MAVVGRARALTAYSRAPREHVERHRVNLHQQAKELRAVSGRRRAERHDQQRRMAGKVLWRKVDALAATTAGEQRRLPARLGRLENAERLLAARRDAALKAQAAALRAHDPERTLERGYALAVDAGGEPLATAEAVREASDFELRMADGPVPARVREAGGRAEESQ
jgi:exodeoxyribonuclease VII large subunit